MERNKYDRTPSWQNDRGDSRDAGEGQSAQAAGSAGKGRGKDERVAEAASATHGRSRGAVAVAALVLILGLGTSLAIRQAGAQGVDAPKPEAAPEAKKRVEPRGRLPAYYSQVIDKEQREKVYAIQSRIGAEIQKLHDQIAMLEQQRVKEVQEVLTPEQLAKVQKMTDDAKAKRLDTARKKKLATAEQPAGEAPPE